MAEKKKAEEPSIEKLKSLAYDTLAQIEYLQKRLVQLNQSIAEKTKESQKRKE